ncbi:MAG: CoA transferase [Dehalococcoidia bacterium]|nr:CoA transferase [Dehalococcoidia bacterium]
MSMKDTGSEDRQAMLGPYRVLDLTDEKGLICGKTLAGLGADVIQIEPPGGSSARDLGPFYRDVASQEESLYWFAYSANKRGITLNLESADGQDLFRKLAAKADFVIESFAPGYLDGLGLGYSALSAINPRIILTSITPFGQSGPWRDFKTCDLVSMALSGYMYLTGDPDRPPVRIGFPQAYLHAGLAAAAGTLVAHYHREVSGEGQWVDVSIHEACAWIPTDSAIYWEMNQVLEERHGGVRVRPTTGARMKRIWQCRDGYVSFDMYGARLARNFMTPLVAWMAEEGAAPDFLKEIDWSTFDYFAAPPELVERVAEPIARFFASRTRDDLFWGGVARRCCIYPVATPGDVATSRQLMERNFWVDLEHPALCAAVRYPGCCVKASESRNGIRRRAPAIGEHNSEVYGELGLSKKDLSALRRRGVI